MAALGKHAALLTEYDGAFMLYHDAGLLVRDVDAAREDDKTGVMDSGIAGLQFHF